MFFFSFIDKQINHVFFVLLFLDDFIAELHRYSK